MAKDKHVPENQRNIVAMGGGKSSEAVLRYILKLTGEKRPRVLLINTATGDRPDNLLGSYTNFSQLGCIVTHLPLFARTPNDLEALLFSQDVIFVGGGNTKSMLAVWKEYGLDKILKKAWKRGVVLAGSSAGGICWFDGCCTDSFADHYVAIPALGILKGSCCPHYDGEAGRQETYQGLIRDGELDDGVAIDEGVGLHFVGKKLHKVVSPNTTSKAYTVELVEGQINQKVIAGTLVVH